MVGLSKPTELTSLEIEDGLYEDGEERQSLVGAGTPSSSHRGGGGRGSRGLGALDALAASGGGGDSYRASLVKRFACLLAVIVLVFAYQAGRDEGYASSKMHDDDGGHDVGPADSKGKKPVNAAGMGTGDDGPTYKPTPAPKDGDVPPTYKPTPGGPKETTPQPTFGNTSWIPEPNPYIEKFNTTEWITFTSKQWETRANNAIDIRDKYGTYCPKGKNPMCPPLDGEGKFAKPNELSKGPSVKCIDTGEKKEECGRGDPWLNKTIWPMVRGPFCANQDKDRKSKFPMPSELAPYADLGYNHADPTQSKDGDAFDGGSAANNLYFDPTKVKDHFVKMEAMLEHYYEGVARTHLEAQLNPKPESPLYAPMLQAHANQIARLILRVKDKGDSKMVIGVLGDSVTSGTDNCYYDAWPEQLRRQLAPLFEAMGITIEIRNGAKNGGWNLAPQMLCANDMLGATDRPNDLGLDFLFVTNPFVGAGDVDVENMIRRSLLGKSHTIVSVNTQGGMDQNAFLERYAASGLTLATPTLSKTPSQLGIPDSGFHYWFPGQNRAFWGMQGDGFCHLTTRSGSSAVVNRNWHWGPKNHQTYADAYALLISRATRQAIEELSAGRTPPTPNKPSDVEQVLQVKKKEEKKEGEEEKEDPGLTWKDLLKIDFGVDEAMASGIGGVHCAIGSANQPGSTLLPQWLRPATGSPFEDVMKKRDGTTFIPVGHDAVGTQLYKLSAPISPPNGAVAVGEWVADPNEFGEEAPRTGEQCRHVDGSTMLNAPNPNGFSWLVWEIPPGSMTIGRAMLCHPRGAKKVVTAETFADEKQLALRFHYAVGDGKGGYKVIEDSHKTSQKLNVVKQECTPLVTEMKSEDLKSANEGGMWVAVEWNQTAILDFDYLVAM